MKPFLSVILALVLMVAVSGSVVNGTMAGFFDTEVSTGNKMTSGTLLIEVIGEPIEVEHACPCKWYTADMELVNCGSRDGIAYLELENIVNIEDALGEDVTSEPEYVAEYGGQLGQQIVPGLGEDCGGDTGPANLVISKHIDIEITYCGTPVDLSGYDKDGDGVIKFWELEYEQIKLGTLPAGGEPINGGWGTYFEYHVDSETVHIPLIAGQTMKMGWVSVWNDTSKLYVEYDSRDTTCWEIAETHVYVGTDIPSKAAPGQFPYGADHAFIDIKEPCHVRYAIPLSDIDGEVGPSTMVYIAAHAEGRDGETGWAMGGPPHKLQIKLHMPDIPEAYFGYDYFDETDPDIQLKCWDHWPTNAYQGDICQFDMKFILNQDSSYRHWGWQSGTGWTYRWFKQ